MEATGSETKSPGFWSRTQRLGAPRQIAMIVAIVTAFVALIGLLTGATDPYDRFVKLLCAVMATEIVIVFLLELLGLSSDAWLRRLKFLVTVLAGHIVLFTLVGSFMREGYSELILLILGLIITLANALGKVNREKVDTAGT